MRTKLTLTMTTDGTTYVLINPAIMFHQVLILIHLHRDVDNVAGVMTTWWMKM